MAQIAKTAAKGHHTFYLDVWEKGTDVAQDGSWGGVLVGFKFWMYGGSWDFNWNSRKVWWTINIGGHVYSDNFGKYDKWQNLTIYEDECWLYQDFNGAASHYYAFSVDDQINQSYSPGNIIGSDVASTFTTTSLTIVSQTGNPTCNIKDNQNNSYTIWGKNGEDGTRNTAKEVHIYGSINDGSTSGWAAKTAAAGNDYSVTYYTSPGINKIKVTAYNVGTQSKGGWGQTTTTGGQLNYYSQVGSPKNLSIISQKIDANQQKIVLQATRGDNGYLNNATGVEFQYQIKNEPIQSIDGTVIGNNIYQATFNTETSNLGSIKMWARTIGSQQKTVYTNQNLTATTNIYYSNWVSINDSDINITTPGTPQGLTIIDTGDNRFVINCEKGTDGTNNTSVGVEIYYTIDGTSPISGNNPSSTAKSYTIGDYILINTDTQIQAVARTVGSHTSYYYSDFTAIEIKTINFYKTPIISQPTIHTVDGKKFTKKSKISIKSQVQLFKHTKLVEYTVGLYKLGQIEPIYTTTVDDINTQIEGEYNWSVEIKSLDLKTYELKKDDRIYAIVTYVVKNGADNNMANNTEVPRSDYYLIESSGVMRINDNDSWHEGQVWINVDGTWKEATDIFVNVNGDWKESV